MISGFPALILRLAAGCAAGLFVAGCQLTPSGRHGADLAPTQVRSGAPRWVEAQAFTVLTVQAGAADFFRRTLDGSAPRFFEDTTLQPGQRVTLLVFAQNVSRDEIGRAELTYDLRIIRPDGSVEGEQLGLAFYRGPLPSAEHILLAEAAPVFWADVEGVYTIEVTVRDLVAGRTVATPARAVSVAANRATEAEVLPAEFDAERWLQSYYTRPSPERLFQALRVYMETLPPEQADETLPGVLGFTDQVFMDNTWLLRAATRELAQDNGQRWPLARLAIGHHLRTETERPVWLSEAEWAELAPYRTQAWPEPDAPLEDAAQLDALWGRFFASGSYAPVAALASVAQSHGGAFGALAALSPAERAPGLPLPTAARRDALLQAALGSLRVNAGAHRLVRGYLEFYLANGEDLAPETRGLLARCLLPTELEGQPTAALAR
jgi:hypothetical protein